MRNGNASQQHDTYVATAVASTSHTAYRSRPVEHGQTSTPSEKALCGRRVSVHAINTWYQVLVDSRQQCVFVARFGGTLLESGVGQCFVTAVLWWLALARRREDTGGRVLACVLSCYGGSRL